MLFQIVKQKKSISALQDFSNEINFTIIFLTVFLLFLLQSSFLWFKFLSAVGNITGQSVFYIRLFGLTSENSSIKQK